MKKALFLIAACCLMLGACAQNNTQNTQTKENKEMKKTLIVYFSATGTTKAAAQRLAKEYNADLDWRDKTLNVFATSGGSGVSGSYNDLKKAYPQYTWGESRLMN